jgi:hypothetical protein
MRHVYSRALVAILAAALLCACGVQAPTATQPSPTGTTPSPVPSPVPSPTFPIVSAVIDGDTLTLTFDQGTHEFAIKPEPSSHFLGGDGRGTWVDVAGTAAAEITLTGFRGDVLNYTGPTSIKSQGPLLLEAREVSEFEGYVKWAVGLSKPACANVVARGSTLTFQFTPTPKTGCALGTVAA